MPVVILTGKVITAFSIMERLSVQEDPQIKNGGVWCALQESAR